MSDENYMSLALSLARRGRGTTSPNPMVGAVIVKKGKIIGRGYHHRAGKPHAEVLALTQAGKAARGADLYVNLEPCCHWGLTPPCADSIAKAGIARVYYGMKDPNPQVCGGGCKSMVEAGIQCEYGLLEDHCRKLNERFIKHITTGLPFVIMKGAMTLDGVIATHTGDSKWITGEKARRHGHQLRAGVDAVLVGVGTVLADDPELTVRLVHPKKGQPLRVVLDSKLRMPLKAKLLRDGAAPTVIFTTSEAPKNKLNRISKIPGVSVIRTGTKNGSVSIVEALKHLGKNNVQSVLIEGGAQVHASALAGGVVDRAAFFYAPKIAGGRQAVHVVGGKGVDRISQSWRLTKITNRRLGDDWLVEGLVQNGR